MKKMLSFISLFAVFSVTAQVNCEDKMQHAKKILDSKKRYNNYEALFQETLPCAESGDPLAQNYIGLMYVHGFGIQKDEAKGFAYIEKAAKSGNAVGEYNLGKLYSDGRGCQLNMNTAVVWYKKAIEQKNSRAAYELGYMYLKGLGVPQDYNKAIEWFQKSDYAMAKHWLGVCYYLGYGVPQNTEKALEYLYGNTTPNSVAFLRNLKIDKREKVLSQTQNAINEANKADKKNNLELISDSREMVLSEEAENQKIKPKTILGEWTGRFIEYDWSGTTPIRVLPIDLTVSKNSNGELQSTINFEGQTFKSKALLQENTLIVEDFKFKLEQLYPHDFKNDKLEYEVFGMNISQKNYNNIPYLLFDVDSFIEYWREPGTPITLILRPKNNQISAQDEALMLALAAQKADFIKVYPVPFKEQLYIAFDLNKPSKVQVSLTSVTTGETKLVVATNLENGTQSYTVDTNNLQKGFYIVQVHENETVHTKTIIKQ
jgi:hypothetical protein